MNAPMILERGAQTPRTGGVSLARLRAIATTARDVVIEWRRRQRSRLELACHSHDQRRDFGFAAGLDAEEAKPFWKQ